MTNSEYSISLRVAGPVGQLHAGLKDAVALPGDGCFPVATGLAQAFNGKGLAARAPRRRHGRQRRIARDHAIGRDRRDHVNQGIESGPFFRNRQRQSGQGSVEARVLALALEPWPGRAFRRERLGQRLPRRIPARCPRTVGDHRRQHQAASDRQTDLE
jgi:hypothetical protein